MEQLFTLVIGLGLVRELMPDMRQVLPGQMPYYEVLDTVQAQTETVSGQSGTDPEAEETQSHRQGNHWS